LGAGVAGGLVVGAVAAYVAKPSGSTVTSTSVSTETITGTPSTTTVTTTVSGPSSSSPSSSSSSSSSSTPTLAFQILNTTEQAELVAIANAIIPTDSNGPGGTTANVAYFVDNQLNGEYGNDGNAFTGGPYILPNTSGQISVTGYNGQSTNYNSSTVTFKAAGQTYNVNYPTTTDVRIGSGNNYQYPLQKKEFWRIGLDSTEVYSNAAYGANFESLSPANQAQVLTDLWNNKPTAAQFQNIRPADFAYELFMLVWAGFLMDPMYGGNQGMVGWSLTGFNGVNMGNFYNEGYTDKQLMVASTPVRLKPASLGQFQQGS
jgi:gluconate 2-dehydrogenase gamma chain